MTESKSSMRIDVARPLISTQFEESVRGQRKMKKRGGGGRETETEGEGYERVVRSVQYDSAE
jgi:hypothetical protein